MIPNFKQYAKAAIESALEFRRTSEVLPTWILIDKFYNSQIIGTAWADDEEKRDATLIIAKIVWEMKAQTVLFVADVWTRSLPKNTPQNEQYKKVSHQLDAIEAIVAQCWNKDQTGFTLIQTYRQHDDGEIVKLDYIESNEQSSDTSTFDIVLAALYED